MVIEKKIIDDDPGSIKSLLNLTENDKLIYIKRLLLANNEPLILENTYYSLKYSLLLEYDISKLSTYKLINENLSIMPYKAERTIGTYFADKEMSKLLLVKEGFPLLEVHEHVFEKNGNPIHYSISYAVSSKTRIRIMAFAPTAENYQGYIVIPKKK